MKNVIKKWLAKYKTLFFKYNNGFFELPFLANSPELIVSSFKSMPFVKFSEELGNFSTSNIFIKGHGYFQKIEEGLWIILSDFGAKRNLSFKIIYDETIPVEYYTLMVFINVDNTITNGTKIFDFEVEDRGWILLKPGASIFNTHLKNQKSIYLNIYFDKNWLDKNLKKDGKVSSKKIDHFLNSSDAYLYLPDLFESRSELYTKITENLKTRDKISTINLLMLKSNTLELLVNFIDLLESNEIIYSSSMSNNDQNNVLKVKQILSRNLSQKFPSIKEIAQEILISETKLKNDFKLQTGHTIFHYFTIKKMHIAKKLILRNELTIKEIAFELGYENQSKFAQAYKRVYNHLPSESK